MQRNNKRFRGLAALIALMLVFTVASGCAKKTDTAKTDEAASAGKPTDVIVTYKDGGKITRGEFDTFLNINKFFNPQFAQFATDPAFQQDMMKQLVTFRVLASRADDKAKAEGDKKAKEQMDTINMYFGAQQGGLEEKLKAANITTQDVESFVKQSMYAVSSAESKVTDLQVKDAYDKKLAANSHLYDIATVRHILVVTNDPATGKETRSKEEALARAKEVQDKLNKGGDFDALAKEYSDDPGSRDKGGKYENEEISQWDPAFGKAAAELPLNTISDPVESSFGYHIMKVEARSSKSFDDVKGSIRSELAETQIYDFFEKELPGLIETNKLPKPEEKKPDAAPGGSAPASPAPAGK
ncbi:peptidylprolyl isomerase [Paenibacillus hamazuiensis]|uniref:peptidylprolyl isomerase n=1 Tax=Paenibacillus hamazuiensis TaxID=2936508 RepID=UPI00200E94B4|nr:peptidylprolyl isomerase [Paenibacillus hamazuiensis]